VAIDLDGQAGCFIFSSGTAATAISIKWSHDGTTFTDSSGGNIAHGDNYYLAKGRYLKLYPTGALGGTVTAKVAPCAGIQVQGSFTATDTTYDRSVTNTVAVSQSTAGSEPWPVTIPAGTELVAEILNSGNPVRVNRYVVGGAGGSELVYNSTGIITGAVAHFSTGVGAKAAEVSATNPLPVEDTTLLGAVTTQATAVDAAVVDLAALEVLATTSLGVVTTTAADIVIIKGAVTTTASSLELPTTSTRVELGACSTTTGTIGTGMVYCTPSASLRNYFFIKNDTGGNVFFQFTNSATPPAWSDSSELDLLPTASAIAFVDQPWTYLHYMNANTTATTKAHLYYNYR